MINPTSSAVLIEQEFAYQLYSMSWGRGEMPRTVLATWVVVRPVGTSHFTHRLRYVVLATTCIKAFPFFFYSYPFSSTANNAP